MKTISLTKGKKALVDDSDFEWLNQYKWHTIATMSNKFYAKNDKLGLLHRFILGVKKDEVDHINGDSLDNRRTNLRICTHLENQRNRKIGKNNTSGYKGVHWSKGEKKWVSTPWTLGKHCCQNHNWLTYFRVLEL